MFTVYAIYSPTFKKIYIGYTADIERRMIEHNHSVKGHTVKYRPWILAYSEIINDKTSAIRREKQLKTGAGRKFIWDHINNLKI